MKVLKLYKNDAELIEKASKNHRDAQQVLYQTHAPKMLSICRFYIKDLQQAEEVLLNGFFKIFKQLETFKNEGSFEGWMRKIMVRESISYLRKKKQLEFSAEDMGLYEKPIIHDTTELDIEEVQLLIDKLPQGYRVVFIMFAIEGYKHSEISTLLEISESTSKSQLFKARKLLQQQMKQLNTTSYGIN